LENFLESDSFESLGSFESFSKPRSLEKKFGFGGFGLGGLTLDSWSSTFRTAAAVGFFFWN